MKSPLPHLFAVSLLLVACSGNPRSTTPAELQPSVVITEENATQVLGTAYHAAFLPVRVLRIVAGFVELPSLIPTPTPGTPAPEPTAPIVNPEVQTVAGPEGGTAIRTWDDRDGDQSYSTGDVFTLSFSDFGADGLVLAGSLTIDQLVVHGNLIDGLTWILDARVNLVGVTVTTARGEETMNGTLRLHREKRATVRTLDLEVTTPLRYGVDALPAGSTMTRNDYTIDFTMGLFADGHVEAPALGGRLAFATDAPLTGFQFVSDPMAGSFVVRGGNAAILTMVPIDFFNAELHYDEDGDEITELVIPIEYASL